MELDWLRRGIGRLFLGVYSLIKIGAKLVGLSYLFAFMYVAIIGTITEYSEQQRIIGNNIIDEFLYAIPLSIITLLLFNRKVINSFIRSTIYGRK